MHTHRMARQALDTELAGRYGSDYNMRIDMAKKLRRNIPAQETVVAALWEFARQQRTDGRNMAMAEDGTRVSLDAVGNALRTIMEAFGYDVTPIQ